MFNKKVNKSAVRRLSRSQVIMVQICWATHALQGWKQLDAMTKFKAKLKKPAQFGSQIETHLREDGIISNRKLVCYGEWYIKLCTHRPSRSKSCIVRKFNKLYKNRVIWRKFYHMISSNNLYSGYVQFVGQGWYGNLSEVETR